MNHLAGETSPYLKQHVNNPVDWYPWSQEAWEKAKRENKLVLVSVGYSACHWCHVMERESFENETTARIMNDHFVCIKVDREERPDVDQVYMAAVQLMTGGGGWPLNCFTLPDGRPIYGGTYFPNATWNDLLMKLHVFFKEDPLRAHQYASELTDGLHRMESVRFNNRQPEFTVSKAREIVANWSSHFDSVEGGPNRAPKFPLPNNYEFLLHYASLTGDTETMEHIRLTLDKMALGGIFDQIGGGFARYSTDSFWKVPHFEKMLYDNAQLVSLYSKAYQYTRSPLYAETVKETLAFIKRELTAPDGTFYAALDADSEGVEGLFYTWTEEEINRMPFPVFETADARMVFKSYFNINEKGYWEHDRYIPLRSRPDEEIARQFGISVIDLQEIIKACKTTLLKERSKRVRPGLDDKILLSWNALMISGYCHAFDATGNVDYIEAAIKAARRLSSVMKHVDGQLVHSIAPGKMPAADAPAFLEDYAFYCDALIALYQSTFDESWLHEARELAELVRKQFADQDTSLFWFTPDNGPALITRKKEIHDNVTPASNSSMAKVFFLLGQYFGDHEYRELSVQMLNNILPDMAHYGSGYSNWGQLLLWFAAPFHEVVLSGEKAHDFKREINHYYVPNKLLAGDPEGTASLPLCEHRFVPGKNLIYRCENRSCQLPVEKVSEALKGLIG